MTAAAPRSLAILALAVLVWTAAPRPATASPYGINAHIPDAARLDRVAEAGIEWVRCDFNWYLFEPAQDAFSWALFDRLVADANARGLRIYATVGYTPAWANGGQGIEVPPSNPADWYQAVYQLVRRYRGSIQHWNLWNEPNLDGFFSGSRQQYIDEILRVGARAVRDADPTAVVVGPELAHLQSGQWNLWLGDVLRQAGDELDVISHHIYEGDAWETLHTLDGPTNLQSVMDVIEANGGAGKPFWLTETGWTTNSVGEADQADFYLELLDGMNARPFWERVFFYELSDDPSITSKWGIVESDLRRKESFFAYRDLVALRPQGGRTPLPPTGEVYAGNGAFQHVVGRAEGSAWSASAALDPKGFLAFGPYTTALPGGLVLEARFRLRSSSASGTAELVRIDVHDATRGEVLAEQMIRASDFASAGAGQDFALRFTPLTTHAIELRTHFEDRADIALESVTVLETGERPPRPPLGGCASVDGDGAAATRIPTLVLLAGLALVLRRSG